MADLTDVGTALAAEIASVCAALSPSYKIKVYQGWPDNAQLTTDLKAGNVHISIFPRPGDKITSTVMGDNEWYDETNNGSTGTASVEVRRQTKQFQITVWANCFERRDPLMKAINPALSMNTRLTLSDGTVAVMSYVGELQDDNSQKQGVYRRDLIFAINWATVYTETYYAIKEIDTSYQQVESASDPASPGIDAIKGFSITKDADTGEIIVRPL